VKQGWTIITHDPKTLPPVDVPVFVAGGNMNGPCILERSEGYDEKGDLNFVWCSVYGTLFYDEIKKKWTAANSEWDDDYRPILWHPFPDVFSCPKCGGVGIHHHADFTDEEPIITCPQCGHTGEF